MSSHGMIILRQLLLKVGITACLIVPSECEFSRPHHDGLMMLPLGCLSIVMFLLPSKTFVFRVKIQTEHHRRCSFHPASICYGQHSFPTQFAVYNKMLKADMVCLPCHFEGHQLVCVCACGCVRVGVCVRVCMCACLDFWMDALMPSLWVVLPFPHMLTAVW